MRILAILISKIPATYVTPIQMFFLLTKDNIDTIFINHVLAITIIMIKIHTLLTL